MQITLENGGLYLVIRIKQDGRAELIHFGAVPYIEGHSNGDYHPLLEMHCLGYDTRGHHGSRHTHTCPAEDLRYTAHTLKTLSDGQLLTVELGSEGWRVKVNYRFYTDIPVARCWTEVTNIGHKAEVLDYITSFAYYGLTDQWLVSFENAARFYIPYNTWHGELQWHVYAAWELGLCDLDHSLLRRLTISQPGTWSCGEYVPMGVIENQQTGEALFWQIEHNGSWAWECSSCCKNGLYLQLTGPNGDQHQFEKRLEPGESFTTVPVAAGSHTGGFEGSIGALTRYRRHIRRPNKDNRLLPIIFNDYMNCLMGDPTEEKVLPLVDAAAAIGCEYYVMDAGWFSEVKGGDDHWWSSIGIWKEAAFRFPHGLGYVMQYIRDRGMVPGLWVELEDIGVDSPLART